MATNDPIELLDFVESSGFKITSAKEKLALLQRNSQKKIKTEK